MYFCQIPSIPQIEQIVTTITEEEECKQSRRGLNTSCEDFFKCFQKTMVDEDFCLKWNDHHSVFFSVAQELLQQVFFFHKGWFKFCFQLLWQRSVLQGTLADVTLATGKSSFPAHRLVLSVCSSFFRSIFSARDPSAAQSYFVYLKDVSAKHLEMLLSYMYRGEINCAESELVRFLATAR